MALGIIEPKTTVQPPGTELLVATGAVDQEEQARLKHGNGSAKNIILVPQPSNDPRDPLLWPRWKREAAFFFIFFNCIVFTACPGPMIAPGTVALSIQLKVPIKHISQLSGYQLLIVGALGPPVSILAQKYGKRPQFLLAAFFGIIGTGICIAGFDQSNIRKSYNVLLAGRMVQGIGTTAYESLSVAAVGDMFFLHQRGVRTALLVLTLACLASFVAIIAGVGFQHLGARNLFVMLLPIQIFGGLGAYFFIPETQFIREQSPVPGPISTLPESTEQKAPIGEQTEHVGSDDSPPSPRAKTFTEELRLYTGIIYSNDGTFKLLSEIFIHLINPAVIWVQLVSAVLVSFFVGTAYTIAQIFTPPPYKLTVAQNGFFMTGALLGGLIGVSAGPLCDFFARFLARRNRGVYEAEFRIPVCIIAVVLFTVGWFPFGWALDAKGKGPLGPSATVLLCSFCYGAVCCGTGMASTSGGLYILDAFRQHATSIFILQMMIKNFLFYAFSTFVNDFAAKEGPGHMCRVWGIVTLAGFATCLPMYVFGKLNRAWIHRVLKQWTGDVRQ